MFETSLSILAYPDPRDPGSAESCLTDLESARRIENVACHRKVLAARGLWEHRMCDAAVDGEDAVLAGSAAVSEMTALLHCSHTAARGLVEVSALLDVLPSTAEGFALGEIDYANLKTLYSVFDDDASPATFAALDGRILAAAKQFSPAVLRGQVWRMWMHANPEEAAAARARRATTNRCAYVRRASNGLSWVSACLTDTEGSRVEALLTEITATVCSSDPRTRGALRADGFLALMHGEAALLCQCDNPECSRKNPTVTTRRGPLMQVVVDADTLLGMADNPGAFADGTPVDAEVARTLAEDATWQAIITEVRESRADNAAAPVVRDDSTRPVESTDPSPADADAVFVRAASMDDEHACVRAEDGAQQPIVTEACATLARNTPAFDAHEEPNRPAASANTDGDTHSPASTVDESADAVVGNEYSEQAAAQQANDHTARDAALAAALAEIETLFPANELADTTPTAPTQRRFISRGRTHQPGQVIHPATPPSPKTPAEIPPGAAELIEEWADAVARGHHRIDGPESDGHGGHEQPPPGALVYRPCADVAAMVRAIYPTCTFPDCTVASRRCELDHVVPFDHGNPSAGGWTIPENLQPLCKRHHDLKSHQYWRCTNLGNGGHYWRHQSGIERITMPTTGFMPPTEPAQTSETATSELAPAPALTDGELFYEPTWWELTMGTDDHPGNDPFLIAHYREHQAVLAHRVGRQPAPF
ncbi:hypothetical protein [Nocardia sp. NPDC052566]|uniref:hypothetical protein n=1 Tax=Nocardia sp. NPDC052566 TaxID=3364330 RepID=UPI0037C70A45